MVSPSTTLTIWANSLSFDIELVGGGVGESLVGKLEISVFADFTSAGFLSFVFLIFITGVFGRETKTKDRKTAGGKTAKTKNFSFPTN